MPPPSPNNEPVVVGPVPFQILVWIVTGVCFGTLMAIICFAAMGNEPPTEHQKSAMKICEWGFTTTLGALIGLLCGRAATPDRVRRR